jgi:hypothetical protein
MALSSGAALAHAVVVSASPGANQKVSGEALSIEVRFNSRIDAARSTLKLFHRDGAAVPLSGAEALDDALKAKAPDLPPGAYRLHWQTLSPDGHISQGDIPFEVGP